MTSTAPQDLKKKSVQLLAALNISKTVGKNYQESPRLQTDVTADIKDVAIQVKN
jgi:hypothetical protein